jgi:alpha,alpha-trehalose phosphorylase
VPARLERISFRLRFRGRKLMVEASNATATYTLLEGEPLSLSHHGEAITVAAGAPVEQRIPPAPERPAPTQPPGREPQRRGTDGEEG